MAENTRCQYRGSPAEETCERHAPHLLAGDAAWPAFRHRVVVAVEQLLLHVGREAPASLLLLSRHCVTDDVQSLLQSNFRLLEAKLALAVGTLLQSGRGGLLNVLHQFVDDVKSLLLEGLEEVGLENFLPRAGDLSCERVREFHVQILAPAPMAPQSYT